MFTLPKGSEATEDNIKKAIDWNEWYILGQGNKLPLKTLKNYYEGQHEHIIGRKKQSRYHNFKAVTNYASYITDIFTGYFVGNAIDYKSEQEISAIKDEFKKETMSSHQAELAEAISKYGWAYEYTFTTETGIKSKTIEPQNCIVAYDDTIEHKPLFAVIYQSKTIKDTKHDVTQYEYKGVTVSDSEFTYSYSDSLELLDTIEHLGGRVPIVEYKNNSDRKGDFEGVLSLIDALNVIQSDRVNDKVQLVESILVVYGATLTADLKKELSVSRAMSLGSKSEGVSVEFLTKQLMETEMEVLKTSIVADIHKISMTPDMTDESFAGNSSGVAIRFKLLPFTYKTLTKEREFEKSLRQTMQVYINMLVGRDQIAYIEPYDIEFIFTHNLPANDFETAQMIQMLKDVVSDSTLIEQLSFIDDAEAEEMRNAKNRLDKMNEVVGRFGTGFDNEDDDATE